MRVISVTTQSIDSDRQVIATNKTIFEKGYKPNLEYKSNVFQMVEKEIKEHMKFDKDAEWFSVTVRTSKGWFVQGYAKGCFK